jgi:hypothetical protein
MLTLSKAEALARTWVDIVTDGTAAIMPEHTMSRSYGWVFFYQSKSYLASKQPLDMLVGNAPIIVDKVSGEIRVTGTAHPIEQYLTEYEATLPLAKRKTK